jgi:hypothetical protein
LLKLILDEHISPAVVGGLRRKRKDISASSLSEWENGCLLGLPDELVLQQASAQKLTLVTYDRRTIPPLLKIWAEANYEHGGVIFVDPKTIPASDIGGLIDSLHSLFLESSSWDWRNRVCFLRRQKS